MTSYRKAQSALALFLVVNMLGLAVVLAGPIGVGAWLFGVVAGAVGSYELGQIADERRQRRRRWSRA